MSFQSRGGMRPSRRRSGNGAQPDRVFCGGGDRAHTRTSSISTDVNNSAARGTTYDALVAAYTTMLRTRGGGGGHLLVERFSTR